jgi:thiol:disulfide interchange protein
VAKVTKFFGSLLVVLGLAGYLLTGHIHPTALIPALFGLILMVCGVAAQTANEKRRKLWMHIAVAVGLLGFLFTARAIWQQIELWRGTAFPYPAAIEEKAAMSIVCLIFTVLCVRSFIAARRGRQAS